MGRGQAIVCIQCGHPVGDPPVLNKLPEGGNCPACAERLLETLPPIFHAPVFAPGGASDGAPVPEEQGEYEEYEGYEGYREDREHERGPEGYSGFEGGGESA